MIQSKRNLKCFAADEGKTFIRKTDGRIMGGYICIGFLPDGTLDTIDNYEEVEYDNKA